MGEIILQAEGIEKAYGKRNILQNVSFVLKEGEILGVAGENGAGKSTLLSLLATIQKPQAGRIFQKEKGFIAGRWAMCRRRLLCLKN